VQAPTKYETVLNLKTAKALGLDVLVGARVEIAQVCADAGIRVSKKAKARESPALPASP
jgi:hypothetical protein